jgi:hypothetical protein
LIVERLSSLLGMGWVWELPRFCKQSGIQPYARDASSWSWNFRVASIQIISPNSCWKVDMCRWCILGEQSCCSKESSLHESAYNSLLVVVFKSTQENANKINPYLN